jgi:sigma-B regulation protein RsbU (phosphoserine phosphatase)
MRILVADDDFVGRLLLTEWLGSWGHEVKAASTGEEAWRSLGEEHFDMILSDWEMPAPNGIELCKLIRARESASYLYVVLCTGKNQRSDFITGMEAGADDFIVKPIQAAELRARVHAAQRMLGLHSKLEERNRHLGMLNDKLGAAYDTIRRDLQMASSMQSRLLPKKLNDEGRLSIDWLVLPSAFLAGDTLGYFTVDDRYLVFYHLDVSGHGIPAALLSVTLNCMLTPALGASSLYLSLRDASAAFLPMDVVSELNKRFQSAEDEYFTMVYGVLDIEAGELRFCQAGHPTPIHLRHSGELSMQGEGGFPVGLWPNMTYDETRLQLEHGDRFILYSDGMTECQDAAGEPYTLPRLESVLRQHAGRPLPELLGAVQTEISAWHGSPEFSDDVSMLILQWR